MKYLLEHIQFLQEYNSVEIKEVVFILCIYVLDDK